MESESTVALWRWGNSSECIVDNSRWSLFCLLAMNMGSVKSIPVRVLWVWLSSGGTNTPLSAVLLCFLTGDSCRAWNYWTLWFGDLWRRWQVCWVCNLNCCQRWGLSSTWVAVRVFYMRKHGTCPRRVCEWRVPDGQFWSTLIGMLGATLCMRGTEYDQHFVYIMSLCHRHSIFFVSGYLGSFCECVGSPSWPRTSVCTCEDSWGQVLRDNPREVVLIAAIYPLWSGCSHPRVIKGLVVTMPSSSLPDDETG